MSNQVSRRQFVAGTLTLGSASLGLMPSALTAPLDIANIKICTELPGPSKGAAVATCTWRQKTVKVGFLGGSRTVQDKVVRHAREWMRYCPLVFNFGPAAGADIKISFNSGCGSWSCIGLCGCSDGCSPGATMNFGWVTDTSNEISDREVILHEFGHALGLVHEHQNPGANIPWNREAVYEYYRRTQSPPWDRKKVDENVFQKYSEDETSHTKYDDASIMRYAIPAQLTLDGRERPWNTDLSPTDKKFIGELYAFLP